MTPTLAVIAKAPVAGRSKTRLCPPCSPQQAAELATAALRDTLAAVLAVHGSARRVLVLDGAPGPWLPDGFQIVAQRGEGLGARLAAAFDDLRGPTFLVGMDTPHVTPRLLEDGLRALDDADASLGLARDGGYWGIGLRRPEPAVFAGIAMSVASTGAEQVRRLRELGLGTAMLPQMRDVDLIADARAVAALAPCTRFARALAAIDRSLTSANTVAA